MSRSKKRAEARSARLTEMRDLAGIYPDNSIPAGAIPADLTKQAPNNAVAGRLYYADQPYKCIDCGAECIWTAADQQWYYEVAKGPIYATAVRCDACRAKQKANS